MVVDVSAHSHFRVFAWWLLVEIWAALRFCDHRGICPADVKVQPTGFTARLTHSKTLGTDRSILCRITRDRFLLHRSLKHLGKILHPVLNRNVDRLGALKAMAAFLRNYLTPAPATIFHGCGRLVWRYDPVSALQTRFFRALEVGGARLLCLTNSPHFWTPHSGRTFLPSATAALGFDMPDRDYLEVCSALVSHPYARLATRRVAKMQRAVVAALQQRASDQFRDRESLEQLDAFLKEPCVQNTERVRPERAQQAWFSCFQRNTKRMRRSWQCNLKTTRIPLPVCERSAKATPSSGQTHWGTNGK